MNEIKQEKIKFLETLAKQLDAKFENHSDSWVSMTTDKMTVAAWINAWSEDKVELSPFVEGSNQVYLRAPRPSIKVSIKRKISHAASDVTRRLLENPESMEYVKAVTEAIEHKKNYEQKVQDNRTAVIKLFGLEEDRYLNAHNEEFNLYLNKTLFGDVYGSVRINSESFELTLRSLNKAQLEAIAAVIKENK